ncbi:MAG: anti-sigma factor [Planctomycetota bacterium]
MPESRDPHEHYFELCAGEALGSLDPAQQQQLAEHLQQGCARCRASLRRLRETAAELAYGADPVPPRPEIKREILQAIRRVGAGSPTSPGVPPTSRRGASARSRLAWALAGGGWAAAAILTVVVIHLLRVSEEAELQLAANRVQLTQLEERIGREELWGDVVTSRQSEIVVLLPTAHGLPDLEARVFYDPSTERAVVVIENLQAPEGKDFQLWAIHSGVPASLGVLDATEDGHAVLRLAGVGRRDLLNAFAVSLENQGGSRSSQPEGEVILMGSVPSTN